MNLPDKLYFMPADDEPGIETGDGRVLLMRPYNLDDSSGEENDYVSDLYRAIVHRYNNFERALEALKASNIVMKKGLMPGPWTVLIKELEAVV